jgi:hypothetical protein
MEKICQQGGKIKSILILISKKAELFQLISLFAIDPKRGNKQVVKSELPEMHP